MDNPVVLIVLVAVYAGMSRVSNVPAVMLLPVTCGGFGGVSLALSGTVAGNLLIVGSIADIIVVDEAAARGVRIDWRTHARSSVPITIAALTIAAVWLWAIR